MAMLCELSSPTICVQESLQNVLTIEWTLSKVKEDEEDPSQAQQNAK